MSNLESIDKVLPSENPSSLSVNAANFQAGGKLNVGGKKKTSKKSVKRSTSKRGSKSRKTKKCWWKLW
jgi:hypothetical protein